ncbi:MAG: TetR/AcrR family transcriptional regulator [Burkholderiales bacterium]
MATGRLKRTMGQAPAVASAAKDSHTPRLPDPAERIAAIATELFIRNGYHGVSYLGIGKALGMRHSNIHYYYRTKAALAEAVLRRVAQETVAATAVIWAAPATSFAEKFVAMRDWYYAAYLRFNPDGTGGRPWNLLSRFSMEADALTPDMRQTIRATMRRLEDDIRAAITMAIERKELAADAPVEGMILQIACVIYQSGQLTRDARGFARVDELLRWTLFGLQRAYGGRPVAALKWPACPDPPQAQSAA